MGEKNKGKRQNQKEGERGKEKKVKPFLWHKRKLHKAGGRGEGLIPRRLAAHHGWTICFKSFGQLHFMWQVRCFWASILDGQTRFQ